MTTFLLTELLAVGIVSTTLYMFHQWSVALHSGGSFSRLWLT